MPRRNSKSQNPPSGKFWPLVKWLLKAGILLAIWGGVALGAVIFVYSYDMPNIKQAMQPVRRPAVTMLANDGSVFARYGDQYGHYVTLNEISPDLLHAVISIEDRRFYNHFGIDVFGLMRAAVKNALAGHVVQGGSTLTQQLAKNLFLTSERTFKRKVQEMLLALSLERTYSKDQILTAYLNRVYFGSGTYGVDAASQIYFNKSAKDLSLREAAILAGLLRAPSRFSPNNSPTQAGARAQTVLISMVDAGYITDEQKDSAAANVPLPRRKPGAGGDGRYFADWVTEQVGGLLENVAQDIVIETTLDINLQRTAERHVDAIIAGNAKSAASQAALITLAPDGAVRAMVGGRDYDDSQFNRATQAMRQPGSAFKPFVYLAAIEQGLKPEDTFEDSPIKIGKWAPHNYDGKYRGTITVRQALAESVNTVAIRVLQQASIPKVIEAARALGITSPIGNDLSLALGTNTLTPLELTSAYASIAAGGRVIMPYAIKEIRNREGQVLYRRQDPNPPQSVNPEAVRTLVDMMGDVIRYGTGRRATLDRPVAGKTGTSSDYHDAWFMGFTADYTTGVWLGNDDNDPMKKVTGGSLPAALWHDFMIEAEAKLPPRELALGLPEKSTDSLITPITETVDVLGDLIKSIFSSDRH